MSIEPDTYCPIVPMALINGAEGIGTGWSTSISPCDPEKVVENILRMMQNLEPEPMQPFYKCYLGATTKSDDTTFTVAGRYRIRGDTLEITELPPSKWV